MHATFYGTRCRGAREVHARERRETPLSPPVIPTGKSDRKCNLRSEPILATLSTKYSLIAGYHKVEMESILHGSCKNATLMQPCCFLRKRDLPCHAMSLLPIIFYWIWKTFIATIRVLLAASSLSPSLSLSLSLFKVVKFCLRTQNFKS